MSLASITAIRDRRSVFVVEDDLELSAVMDRILKGISPEIHLSWATSAEEALVTLKAAALKRQQKPYDLIIADIFLEGEGTGLDLWQYCHLQHPDVPWVVTSGAEPGKFPSLSGAPFKPLPFLHKPFSVADGRQLFRSLLYPS